MIELNELRTESKYWFDMDGYSIFGKYIVRQRYYIKLTGALIFLGDKNGKIFSDENLMLDARELNNIRISEKDPIECHAAYFKNFSYGD